MSKASNYFRMYKTLLEMLQDRGYDVDEMELQLDMESWQLQYFDDENSASMTRVYLRPSDNDRALVTFEFETRADKAAFTTLINKLKEEGVTHAILICPHHVLTPAARRQFARLTDSQYRLEVFEHGEMIFNPTHHDFVPRHIPLSQQDKEAVLERYRINQYQLPQILRTDPIVRYLGVEPGTVLEITRRFPTSGLYTTYRLVV